MNSLLIVIDFINDIVHPDGKISSVAQSVEDNHVMQHANGAIKQARSQSVPVVYVKVGFSANYVECPRNSPVFGRAKELGALQLNTWGTQFHDEIDVHSADTIVIKHRISPFYSTSLQSILKAQHIDHVIVCGVSTNMAVETLARDLHDRDYQITVLKDACAAADLATHKASLKNIGRIARVCNVGEFKIPIV